MTQLKLYTNEKELNNLLATLPGTILTAISNHASDTMEKSKPVYIEFINKEIAKNDAKHYRNASTKRVKVVHNITPTGEDQHVLKQTSRAGIMMELQKKNPGGAKINGHHILIKGMNNRVDAYLRSIKKNSVVIDGNTITGVKPPEPMKQTFEEFTVPFFTKFVGDKIMKEINEAKGNLSGYVMKTL